VNITAEKKAAGIPTTFRLVIRNPSARDILVKEIAATRPETVIIGSDETATSLFAASEGVKYKAIIGADSERWFRMYLVDKDPADLPVNIEILWHPVTAYWLDRAPVRLRLSTGRLRELRDEAERRWSMAKELQTL
jgi:hypothetical protein